MRERTVLRKIDLENEEITFTLPNTRESFVAKLSELPPESVKVLVARAVNSSVGNITPIVGTDRLATMQRVWENLRNGIFTIRTPDGARGMAQLSRSGLPTGAG